MISRDLLKSDDCSSLVRGTTAASLSLALPDLPTNEASVPDAEAN
jgi:hypothetical protein